MTAAISLLLIGQPVPVGLVQLQNIHALTARYEIPVEWARQYLLGIQSAAAGEPLEQIRCRCAPEAWFAAGWHDKQMGKVTP